MTLNECGISIGELPSGSTATITDVAGVRVGHADATRIDAGVTAVVPYPDLPRRYYVGGWSLDDGDAMTGVYYAQDFGTLSGPLLLTPTPAAGKVYNGLLDYGYGLNDVAEDPWPPVIVNVNGHQDSGGDIRDAIDESLAASALAQARGTPPPMGTVGVGRGRLAFGVPAGVGSASRGVAGKTVGVLLVANGGEPDSLSVAGKRRPIAAAPTSDDRSRTFAAVVATDASLIPRQLDRLAQRAAFGLVRVGLVDARTTEGVVLAFSTAPVDDDGDSSRATVAAVMTAEPDLPPLFQAAAEACEEAVLSALLATDNGVVKQALRGSS
ncbi:MAG: P1 family peptidase [Candidatus Latescibacterota bacterium]|nr:P1 family peptidase [Candidatus Latescibacterota bacterium]